MKKIGMVYSYMGKWPNYLRLFLESCKYNPSVDFLIFTDCGEPGEHSENVKIIPMNLSEFNALASLKLGMDIKIKTPYKLCDFKPCYGVVFEDYIQKYEYWGYGDIDVIFGNIRKFITDDLLNNYDIITSGKGFLFGHFTLMRNSPEMKRLFENSIDYKKVFQEENHFGFDECHSFQTEGGATTVMYLLNGGYIFDCITEIESLTHVAQRLHNKGELKVYSKHLFRDGSEIGDGPRVKQGPGKFSFTYKWENGRITSVENGEEFLYLHLYNLKHDHIYNNISQWNRFPDKYIICKDGIIENELFSVETQREISLHYCGKYFPRTTILLSALTPDYKKEFYALTRSDNKTFKERYTNYFLNNLDKFSLQAQERLREILELERLKIDLLEAVSTFGHFTYELPKKNHPQSLKELDLDSEYSLHKDTQLIQTKWNWYLMRLEEAFVKNIDLPASQFHVILAPAFLQVTEKHISKPFFDLLKNFAYPNTLGNALKAIKEAKEAVPDLLESELLETELTEQLEEFIFSGILLKNIKS